jgi:hypothetical protein
MRTTSVLRHSSRPNITAEAALVPERSVEFATFRMLTSLKIKPKAVRRSYPELVGSLEAACAGCRERSRCDAELAQGTAADTYQEFCPNAQRLNALAAVQAATR